MFHGGGWLINDKSIMDQTAAYLATHSEYVVCNVDYRLLADHDNTVTLNQIVNLGDRLGSAVFSESSHDFQPSYLPPGMSAEEIAAQGGLDVQAAILSYGASDVYQGAGEGFESYRNPFWLASGSLARGLFGNDRNVDAHPELYRALSPIHRIRRATDRPFPPQLLTVGTDDPITTPESVKAYRERLEAARHPTTYWEYEGRSHAFLDSGSNALLGNGFEVDAPKAIDVMIRFLDSVFVRAPESS